MDYEMPEMNGPETTTKIRELLYSHDVDQPIIVAVTGHEDERYRNIALKAGMNVIF